MLNGKAISTTLLSKDTYDAMARIIIRGTGPANETTQETTPTTATPETPTTDTNQNQTQTNTTSNTQTPENTVPEDQNRTTP